MILNPYVGAHHEGKARERLGGNHGRDRSRKAVQHVTIFGLAPTAVTTSIFES